MKKLKYILYLLAAIAAPLWIGLTMRQREDKPINVNAKLNVNAKVILDTTLSQRQQPSFVINTPPPPLPSAISVNVSDNRNKSNDNNTLELRNINESIQGLNGRIDKVDNNFQQVLRDMLNQANSNNQRVVQDLQQQINNFNKRQSELQDKITDLQDQIKDLKKQQESLNNSTNQRKRG